MPQLLILTAILAAEVTLACRGQDHGTGPELGKGEPIVSPSSHNRQARADGVRVRLTIDDKEVVLKHARTERFRLRQRARSARRRRVRAEGARRTRRQTRGRPRDCRIERSAKRKDNTMTNLPIVVTALAAGLYAVACGAPETPVSRCCFCRTARGPSAAPT